MRAHVPIGFSLPYYSLEGNIVSQELTIKKSIKGTKEKVGDVSSLRVEIYSLQNKVKTVGDRRQPKMCIRASCEV